MAPILQRLGAWCATHPWRTVLIWLSVVAAVTVLAGLTGGVLRDTGTVPGSSSAVAAQRLVQGFPDQVGAHAHVVAHMSHGEVDEPALERTASAAADVAGVAQVTIRRSDDGATALIDARFDAEVADLDAAAVTAALTQAGRQLGESGARVAVGGEVPESIQGPNGMAEGIGVAVALAVLLLAFGSAVAAALPLLIAGVGVGVGIGLITLLAAVVDVNTVSPTLGAMLGLGVGIDYALFIIARHRRGLAAGQTAVEAAAAANRTAGASVVVAGVSVLIGITGLALSGVPSFASMGFAAGLVVLATMAAAVTLLPAMLGLLGPRVFGRRARRALVLPVDSPTSVAGPGRTGPAASTRVRARSARDSPTSVAGPGRTGPAASTRVRARSARDSFHSIRAERFASRVVARPGRWLAVGLLALLVLAAPALSIRLGQSDAGSEDADQPTRQAYDMVSSAFGPGANGPLLLVANRDAIQQLDGLSAQLATVPGVAEVWPAVVADDGGTAVIQVVPSTGPSGVATDSLVRRLADQLPDGVDVTGPTAAVADMTDTLSSHLWWVILAVLGATFLLLLIVFRSLVVPLKAVLGNLLSVCAAFGILTVTFQTDLGARLMGLPGPIPIVAWAPVVLFAILFGLSMDYEVFMLSAIREQRQSGVTGRAGIVAGLSSTARIVIFAAAIMVAVAAGFAVDPSVMVKIIGVGMASAILVDVTLVRMLVVPAAMALFGEANWYLPRWLARILPHSPDWRSAARSG